jgi:hypothetical protein
MPLSSFHRKASSLGVLRGGFQRIPGPRQQAAADALNAENTVT